MALSVGDKLGPYELIAPIGAGGMGEVWKARDTRLDRIVAIKLLKGQHSARFEQEARAIAALNHPHICQIFDVGPDYLVLEYVKGTPLSGPLPVEQAGRLALQIADALAAAHRKAILHRDLKPANVLVAETGAKMLDFGLATSLIADDNRTRTIEGSIMGTPAYMSPEQAQGQPLDERSDIFSFGSLLYEMLSGEQAFRGESFAETLSSVLRDEPATLRISSPLVKVATRCLKKAPAERFQSMAEVKAALETKAEAMIADARGSIAVLPFVNMSSDPQQEYFSDGLAEDIINALVQVSGLKVIARTSAFAFKGQNTDVRRIAETLGVAHVLEGSVRKASNRIRVTAQLINAADGAHLWSQRFDRDLVDVFEVQDEIAGAITSALRIRLGEARTLYAPHPEAHEFLLKGRYQFVKMTPESVTLAREYFSKAVDIDRGYAAAHAALGACYAALGLTVRVMPVREAVSAAAAAAYRAVEVNPSCAEGHALLCSNAAFFDLNWADAERRFTQAMRNEPVPIEARRICAGYLFSLGRPREAAEYMERVVQEDPLNSLFTLNLGICLHSAGEHERAFECFWRALELNEKNFLAHANLGFWLIEQGRTEDAAEHLRVAYKIAPANPTVVGGLAANLNLMGDEHGAAELLTPLRSDPGTEAAFFGYYSIVSDFERAAEWATKAIDSRTFQMPFALQFACHKGLRASKYWPALAKKMNLPGF
jgi:serine/threonine-protein kinase